MKPTILLLLTTLFLVSCAAPLTPGLVPTQTFTPEPTATNTPTLTPTLTPTATPEAWVAIAEEYSMPEDMARQLVGRDVNFETDVSPYVDGILVIDNATGEELFYFDNQATEEVPATQVWVATNLYAGAEEDANITETISDGQARSKEMTAWLHYKASKWRPDVPKIKANLDRIKATLAENGADFPESANFPLQVFVTNIQGGGQVISYGYTTLTAPNFTDPNSAPFEKNLGATMNIEVPDEGGATEHVFLPIAILDLSDNKVKIVKLVIRGSKNNIDDRLDTWFHKMNGLEILRVSDDYPVPSRIQGKSEKALAALDTTLESAMREFAAGNIDALTQYEIIIHADDSDSANFQ